VPDSSDGPTVLRILLGSQLRRLREARGITARQAAAKIRASESKISRIELGRNAIREIDVLDLLTLYGVEEHEREQLLALAAQSNKPGWWHRYNDILPDWFQAYVGMEEAARSIRVYEAQFIPGLLQTEDYATAVISLGDHPIEHAERLVVLRKERQRRFREGRLKLWVVLDEAVLRRPVAGVSVQLEQLRYLRECCAHPTLTLQVIPYGAGGHAAPTGFSILRFAERDLPDVVYVENLTSALYLDKQSELDRYLLAMERLSIVAYEPRETPRLIDEIIAGLERTEHEQAALDQAELEKADEGLTHPLEWRGPAAAGGAPSLFCFPPCRARRAAGRIRRSWRRSGTPPIRGECKGAAPWPGPLSHGPPRRRPAGARSRRNSRPR
jgi:transcriptional regulator with XRE-family HTH domain